MGGCAVFRCAGARARYEAWGGDTPPRHNPKPDPRPGEEHAIHVFAWALGCMHITTPGVGHDLPSCARCGPVAFSSGDDPYHAPTLSD